jgi:urea transporter
MSDGPVVRVGWSGDVALNALRGAAQVFFVESALAGALFIAAVAVASIGQAAGAGLGLLVATIVGRAVGASTSWARGLHGYNGLLIGLALVAQRGVSPGVLAMVVVGAACSAATLDAVTRVSRTVGTAPLTAPFIVLTLGLLVAARSFDVGAALAAAPPIEAVTAGTAVVLGTVRGLGQVFLQGGLLPGVLVLLGLLVASWRLAALAVVGSCLGALTGVALDRSPGEVAGGVLGYDAALAAVGVAVLVGWPGVRGVALSLAAALIAAVTAALWTAPFAAIGLPRLTSAFVVVTTVILIVVGIVGHNGRRSSPSTDSF